MIMVERDGVYADILPHSSNAELGRGWYAPESFGGARFRWAKNDAEIFVAALRPVRYAVQMTIEPGPAVHLKPFILSVLDGTVLLTSIEVGGRQQVRVDLQPAGPKVHRLILRAEGGGESAPNDPRILNFRVFDIAVEEGVRDILPPTMNLGKGWYPLEEHAGKSFRWVNNDAEISVSNPEGTVHLDLDVEPGPGHAGEPIILSVLRREGAATKVLAKIEIKGRQSIGVPLPQGDQIEVVLHTDAHGRPAGADPRLLNFRVYPYFGEFNVL